MSNSKRVTISISDSLYQKAQVVMKERDIDEFSGYLHQLIREDWESRGKEVIERRIQDIRAAMESEPDKSKALEMLREVRALREGNLTAATYPEHKEQFSTVEERVDPKAKLSHRPAKLKKSTKN
jgi:hypothetical protein